MKVTIKVNDGDQHTVESQSDIGTIASTQAPDRPIDGGAPSINDPGGNPSAGADQLDIGGPPQWLKDAIDRSKGEKTSASANGADTSSSNGGAAPSF